MTFEMEQNLIFAGLLGFVILIALGFGVFSALKAKTAAPNDRPYFLVGLVMSVLVAVFYGFHLWQVSLRF